MPFKDEEEMHRIVGAMWSGGDSEGERAGELLMELWNLEQGPDATVVDQISEMKSRISDLERRLDTYHRKASSDSLYYSRMTRDLENRIDLVNAKAQTKLHWWQR